MKTLLSIVLLAMLMVAISACEHKVSMETTVHEDGSLEKIITLETEDTTKNFIGIGPENGWKLTTELIIDSANVSNDKSKKWKAKYEKSFASAQEASEELASSNDTLFQISSKFEKKFKWFYTYINYSDAYHAINRMNFPLDDFIAPEDITFINRLPAEGKVISKADSLYLSRLHEKIFDIYGLRAIYESHFRLNEKLIQESGLEPRWLDTLKMHKESLYHQLVDKKDVPEDYLYKAMDSLGIPIPFDTMRKRYDELYKLEEAKTNFINHASEGKYTHVINMPWEVMSTNADSVAGNRLQWTPPSIKFLLKDYEMYAETRKPNAWAIVLSAAILIFAGYLFWKRK